MSGKTDMDTDHVETYDFSSLQSELGLVDDAQQDDQQDVAFADHLQSKNRLAFADYEAPETNLTFEELAFHRRTAPAATAPHMQNPLLDKDPLANKKSGKPNHPYAPRKLPKMAVDTRPVTSGLSFAAIAASSAMKSGQKSPDPETIPVPIDLHEQDKHQADTDDGTRAAPPQAPNMADDALHQRPNMLLNVLLGVPPGATPPPPPPAPVAMLPQQQQHQVPGRFVKLNVNDLFASAGGPPGPAGHMQKPNLTASQEIKQLLEDGGSKNDTPQPKSMKPDSQE